MTGLTRKRASEIIAKHFNSVSQYEGGTYKTYSVKDNEIKMHDLVQRIKVLLIL